MNYRPRFLTNARNHLTMYLAKRGISSRYRSDYEITRLVADAIGIEYEELEGSPGRKMVTLSTLLMGKRVNRLFKGEKSFSDRQTQAIYRFYRSFEWRRTRYEVLQKRGNRCECCGNGPDAGKAINVDHIKPVSRYWELRLDPKNLQVLCEDCNAGKGSRFTDDWRSRK